jgi:hypothetical protein
MNDYARMVEQLSDLEKELLLGESKQWGSWMMSCGKGLIAKGLGTTANGSIMFDPARPRGDPNPARAENGCVSGPPTQADRPDGRPRIDRKRQSITRRDPTNDQRRIRHPRRARRALW